MEPSKEVELRIKFLKVIKEAFPNKVVEDRTGSLYVDNILCCELWCPVDLFNAARNRAESLGRDIGYFPSPRRILEYVIEKARKCLTTAST